MNKKSILLFALAAIPILIASVFFAYQEEEVWAPQSEHIVLGEPAKAIYLTTNSIMAASGWKMIDTLVASGGNAVVIDIEHGGGQIAFTTENALLTPYLPKKTIDLKQVINTLHDQGLYVILRHVVFNNPFLAKRHADWRIHLKDKKLWYSAMGNAWIDPSDQEAQVYNLTVIEELALTGADEIQLDYIRFPTSPWKYLDFDYDESAMNRADVINDFLRKAKLVLQPYGVKLSADVFGGIVFGEVDWKILGQHVPTLAEHVDVIAPMTYPSHYADGFYGYYGHKNRPYKLIYDSIEKFIAQAAPFTPEIRPWIQGFAWKAPSFGPVYIQEQITASNDAGGKGFMIWNASNTYTASWSVFDSLKAAAPASY